jgi:hypothetical protein
MVLFDDYLVVRNNKEKRNMTGIPYILLPLVKCGGMILENKDSK